MLNLRPILLIAVSVGFFSACSKGGDEVLQGMAKVQFSLSLEGRTTATKASDAVVQEGELSDFRGITDITLLPYETKGTVRSTDERLGFCEGLSDIVNLSEGNHGLLYPQQMIPYKTASFLFYGKAKPLYTDKTWEGSLVPYGLESMSPSSIRFSPEAIGVSSTASTVSNFLVNHLTSIANVSGFKSTYPELFRRFTNNGELMSGSKTSIGLLLTDLYRNVLALDASPVRSALLEAILDEDYIGYSGNVYFKGGLGDYPGAGLPDGAAVLRWGEDGFLIGDDTGALLAPLDRYSYPISLWYYSNSTIRTTENEENTYSNLKSEVFDTQTTWGGVLGHFEKSENAFVGHKTLAVALVQPVRYAVGMLELTLKQVSSETLLDHEGIAVNVNNLSYPVTGLILGGQKAQLYDFSASGGEDYYVYDTHFGAQAYMSHYASEVTLRTLALESAPEQVINFAIELRNDTSDSFVGATGIVLPGSKFYLLGRLDLDSLTDAQRTVEGIKRTKVFEKHFKTAVNVRMASLKDAYTIIPDLRQPQLQVGLVVDFDWSMSTPTNVPIL